MDMVNDIYLCCIRRNAPATAKVRKHLFRRGLRTHGPFNGREADEAIAKCAVFVVVLSARTNNSPEVLCQVEMAVKAEKPIVTIQIDRMQMGNRIGYYLGARHTYDASAKPLRRHFKALSNMLCDMLDKEPESRNKGRFRETLELIFLNKVTLICAGFFLFASLTYVLVSVVRSLPLSDHIIEHSIMLTGPQDYPALSEDGTMCAYVFEKAIHVCQTDNLYELMAVSNPFDTNPAVGFCGKDMIYAVSGTRAYLYPLKMSGTRYSAADTGHGRPGCYTGRARGHRHVSIRHTGQRRDRTTGAVLL